MELSTCARPYAKAVFDLAMKDNTEDKWDHDLDLLAKVVGINKVRYTMSSPKKSTFEKVETVIGICGKDLSYKAKKLVSLLTSNGRIDLIPYIHNLFKIYKANSEGVIRIEVTTAGAISEEQKKELSQKLNKKFNCETVLSVNVDRKLMGGMVVKYGDTVIDGSVKARLDRLKEQIAC